MRGIHGLFLALAAPLAMAQATWFGVQATVNAPSGPLKGFLDNRTGLGGGAHLCVDLWDGHVLRTRLDATAFPTATVEGIRQKARVAGLGQDYLFFPFGRPEYFYLTAGVAIQRWTFDPRAGHLAPVETTTRPAWSAGLGYQWSATFGTELRFQSCKAATDFKAEILQAGLTVRF